jgi:ABC-type transporter Mla maintaining outer membrane lipid asymmetry permease subunit MlaE
MKNNRIRKSFIITVALSGAVINTVYSFGILRAFFDPRYNNAIREIMISAAVLEIGCFRDRVDSIACLGGYQAFRKTPNPTVYHHTDSTG